MINGFTRIVSKNKISKGDGVSFHMTARWRQCGTEQDRRRSFHEEEEEGGSYSRSDGNHGAKFW